ncbi:MAG: polysaccharide biosynthesis tyrosine autokinase [Lachnospiraceae bacterium]|nr:polysaccharide biosynthesis tyrosine autokinase [Lachnospiraceae bacterium]
MQENKSINQLPFNDIGLNFDLYSIIKDIGRAWLPILLLVVSAGMATHVLVSERYQPVYTTQTTLFVTNGGTDNNIYNNLFSTEETSTKFTQILNSNILKKKVAEEIGLSGFSGTAVAENIEETNLLVLKVQAGTPELSFKEMQAILENYELVSADLLGNVILEILEAPEVPQYPDTALNTKPAVRKAIIYTFGVLVAILALFSFLKDTIRSDKDVERKLDTGLLSSIPHENKYKTFGAWFRKSKSSILITNPAVSFRYVETIKKLTRKVKNRMDEKDAKSILITSVLENEGKSTVVANLALALAQESKKVLLIDCDFRKPSQFKVLGMQNVPFDNLGEVLNGKSDIRELIQKVPGTELYCILNAMAYPNSTEMICSGLLKRTIEYFGKQMDYIIVDTSPLALVADAEELAGMVDVSAIVVKQHLVEAKDINDAIDVLNGENSRMLGCIFNDVHVKSLEKVGRYGYGYGYGYGGHYER